MGRGIVGLLIVIGVVAGLIVGFSRTRAPDPGNPQKSRPDPGIQIVYREPVKVVIECESADRKRWENKEPVKGQEILLPRSEQHNEVLGYLEIPDGWIAGCYDNRKGKGGQLPGRAYYDFDIPEEGTYYLYLRAKWFDSCGNSCYVRIDDGPYHSIDDTEGKITDSSYRWDWHPLLRKGELAQMQLKPGKHTLELNTKEDGPKFDKFLISNEGNVPGRSVVNP